jgi:hypothetical protein
MASGALNSRNGFARSSDMVIPRRDADHSDQVALSYFFWPQRCALYTWTGPPSFMTCYAPNYRKCFPKFCGMGTQKALHRQSGSSSSHLFSPPRLQLTQSCCPVSQWRL